MLESKACVDQAGKKMGEIQIEIEHLQKAKAGLSDEIFRLQSVLTPVLKISPKTEVEKKSENPCSTPLGGVIYAAAMHLQGLRLAVTEIIGDLEL